MVERYQKGSLRRQRRKSGAQLWAWRYRLNGVMKQETFPVTEFPAKRDLWEHLEIDIARVNQGKSKPVPQVATMAMLILKYREEYLPDLAKSTQDTDGSTLKVHIEPRWSDTPIADVYPENVENWLRALKGKDGKPLSPASKGRTRRLMKQLIDRAMFWRLIPQVENPMKLVRVKGSSTRQKKPIISPKEHVNALIAVLEEPYDLMVLVAATLGLRVSEVVALHWDDFSWEEKKVTVRRAYTHSALGKVKTPSSWADLPIEDDLRDQLIEFRTGDSELVFPSPVTEGYYSADTIRAKKIQPALEKLGLPKIGWHSFHHSFKSRAGAGKATLTQQKDMMRHASIPIGDMYGGTPVEEMRPLMRKASKGLVRKKKTPAKRPSTP